MKLDDPDMEILQIERKLRAFEQQKQQMQRNKLEYQHLIAKLAGMDSSAFTFILVYKETNNVEEMNKLQDQLSNLVEQAKQYAKQREDQVAEIKSLKLRIEELKRVSYVV